MAPPLLLALVDDAGLFPPERLPMEQALARHRTDAEAADPVLTHRFLCPATRVEELKAHLGDGEVLRLGLIGDTGVAGVPAAVAAVAEDDRVRLEAVEVALPADGLGRATVDLVPVIGTRTFCEVPRAPGWEAALQRLAERGLGAKIRCGGLRADLFPRAEELAAFIGACTGLGLPFKATAGLHAAVRHRDPATGFVHHGFLNLLVAVCRAVDGASHDELVDILVLDDSEALCLQALGMPAAIATSARRLLVAYGSCSTSEPLDDLARLGLLKENVT